MYEETVVNYKGKVQLAVVDHISCPSATLFPIKKIANRLRALGVLVLVDGAHAAGQGM
jgi:isopenicillin-N epimerase